MELTDLSPMLWHTDGPEIASHVVAVGWLGKTNGIPREEAILPRFIDSLKRLTVDSTILRISCRGVRCHYQCRFCETTAPYPATLEYGGKTKELGCCELWIPDAEGTVFVTPQLCIHNVEIHGYTPPQRFQEAAIRFLSESNNTWDANAFIAGL